MALRMSQRPNATNVPGAEVGGANAGLGPVALHHPTRRVALGEDAGAPGPSTAP